MSSCSPQPRFQEVPESALDREAILAEAFDWLGAPYKFGGNLRSGIDCSHFVSRVYSGSGYPTVYCTTRRFREGRQVNFRKIERSEILKGDVVIFHSRSGELSVPGHCGLILTESTFLGAQSKGVGEQTFGDMSDDPECDLYWGKTRPVYGYFRYYRCLSKN